MIHNPLAGQRDRRADVAAAAARLRSAGWDMEVSTASDAEDVERLARGAVTAGVDVVVAAGGDGTLNAAVQAVACQPVALGVLPIGTTNVWAREMGIPMDIQAATKVLLSGEVARADLGVANGRYFLFVAGTGFDASVTRVIDGRAKRKLGMLAYVIAAVVEALKLRGEEATIVANGRSSRQRVLMVVVSNIRLYGGVLMMAPDALADDGLLDVCVFRGHGLVAAARHAVNTLLGRHQRDPEVDYFRARKLSIESRASLPVQLDGDYFGTTPVEISVVPGALLAIVPAGPHPQFRQWTGVAGG